MGVSNRYMLLLVLGSTGLGIKVKTFLKNLSETNLSIFALRLDCVM